MKEFKKISIIGYLESIGIFPVNKIGNQFLYFSPINNENTPSFFVEPTKNVFFDWSNGSNGDIIDLVREKEKISFKQALIRISELKETQSFSFSGFQSLAPSKNQITILDLKEVKNSNLIQYINSRCIDLDLARLYLREVHYLTNNKKYFALGFKNDSGGFELRNGLGFKGKTKNAISTFENNSKNLSIFEGFFDFLSALQYYNLNKPSNYTIVLNSLSNLNEVKTLLNLHSKVFCFLDNDVSGTKGFEKIQAINRNTINMANSIYKLNKDFNEYLMYHNKHRNI